VLLVACCLPFDLYCILYCTTILQSVQYYIHSNTDFSLRHGENTTVNQEPKMSNNGVTPDDARCGVTACAERMRRACICRHSGPISRSIHSPFFEANAIADCIALNLLCAKDLPEDILYGHSLLNCVKKIPY